MFKLNKGRHYGPLRRCFEDDTRSWREKKDAAVWRGGLGGSDKRGDDGEFIQRAALIRRMEEGYWTNESLVDVAVVQSEGDHAQWLSKAQIMAYKMIISVEGNDVASGLKWALLSTSAVIMPPPTLNSWALESSLVPWVHYIPVRQNMSNLAEMARWCLQNLDACEAIGMQGRCFAKDWLHEEEEDRIQASVLARVTTLLENDNSTCGQCERGCP